MNEIIKIEEREGLQFVDARNLHTALGVGRDFSTWISEKIVRFGFVKDTDYQTCSPDLGSEKHGAISDSEQFLHNKYTQYRKIGEWFIFDGDTVELVKSDILALNEQVIDAIRG